MTITPLLTSRLYRDLAELHESPYPGVTVFTDDANIREFCLVLTPPSGPWKDLSLHFDVEIPDRWPASPPRISTSVHGIDHPNLFGDYICCDLLKDEEYIYRESGYTGGYSPALTLRGLFLQFLTFFSSTKVDQDYGGHVDIGDYMITRYAYEYSVASLLSQGRHSFHTDQLAQEREWESNPNPEITLNTFILNHDTEPCIQKVKDTKPHPERLHRFEQLNPRWLQTLHLISAWKCPRCPYGSSAFPHHRKADTSVGMDIDVAPPSPSSRCTLDILNDDALLDLAHYMPTETLLSFCQAYPRADALVRATHVLLQRELHCFFLKTSLQNSVLGIGIALHGPSRSLSSNFDWLSEVAFRNYKVRTSIQKKGFNYFLPLAFSPAHFERVKDKIWLYLSILDVDLRQVDMRQSLGITARPPALNHLNVHVIYRLMNNVVVSLMKSCDDAMAGRHSQLTLLHASERAVIAYCHLFHLLICLSRTNRNILQDATTKVVRFLRDEASRTKQSVPDLGEFIVMLTLVLTLPQAATKPTQWVDIAGPFLQEVVTRNVRWVLKDVPELEVMEQGASDFRLSLTFKHSRTSLRLIMFQTTFLSVFLDNYGGRNLAKLDDNYGFAEQGLPEKMVEEIKNIYAVAFWPQFFRKVGYEKGVQFGKEKFSDMLREAVRLSERRGYHKRGAMGVLQAKRRKNEQDWLRLGVIA